MLHRYRVAHLQGLVLEIAKAHFWLILSTLGLVRWGLLQLLLLAEGLLQTIHTLRLHLLEGLDFPTGLVEEIGLFDGYIAV